MNTIQFLDAVNQIGFLPKSLRVESIITTSMNNYVININCDGITWGIVVRYPKTEETEESLNEKVRSAQVSMYLADLFENGIPLDESHSFYFGGRSFLVEPSSIKKFFTEQEHMEPIRLRDELSGTDKEIKGIEINPEYVTYNGVFSVNKGAPASETLEDDFSYWKYLLRSLAVLHTTTGAKKVIEKERFLSTIRNIETTFNVQANEFEVKSSTSEEKRYKKYLEKYGAEKQEIIKQEVFLQSNASTPLLRELVDTYFAGEMKDSGFDSFIHGDMHGANFIIVEYAYEFVGKQTPIDRVYLNSLYEKFPAVNQITIEVEANGVIHLREYKSGDEHNDTCFVTKRKNREDIYLIDIDTGVGIDGEKKACYLYDLVVLSLSMKHWSELHTTEISYEEIYNEYKNEFEV